MSLNADAGDAAPANVTIPSIRRKRKRGSGHIIWRGPLNSHLISIMVNDLNSHLISIMVNEYARYLSPPGDLMKKAIAAEYHLNLFRFSLRVLIWNR
jgi:hypothetical protein